MKTRTDPLSLGEGRTPVLKRPVLARQYGTSELWVKAGWLNPTGSYKDRIARETIRHAPQRGARGWVGTSSGNAGAAMSAYGARADLPGFLCAATNAPREKLQSLAPYGVTLLSMADIGLPEMNRIAGLAIDYQLQLAVTVYRHNPERMRGAEAIGVELIDQGPFTHICVPTGGGGLLAAIAGGLASSAKRPVVVCARPQGYAQISLHVEGEMREPEIDACTTAISGLQLPYPPDRALASAVTRESGGWGCPVSDEEAWETQAMLFQQEGIFVEPASALAHAAIQQDLRTGGLTGTDRPIAVLTGTGLKDLRRFSTADQGASTAVTLDDHHALLKATFADGAVSESGALPKNERSR